MHCLGTISSPSFCSFKIYHFNGLWRIIKRRINGERSIWGDFVVGRTKEKTTRTAKIRCYCCCRRRNLRCLSPAIPSHIPALRELLECLYGNLIKKKEISEKYVMQKRIVCRKSRDILAEICWRRKLKIYFSSLLSSCSYIHTDRLSSSIVG